MQKHERWFAKARSDLLLAQQALEVNNQEVFDAAIYHTQQCAEKALKGFLVFHEQQVVKTHDLDHLLFLCFKIDDEFAALYVAVGMLNPFAVELRYPDEETESDLKPSRENLREAINVAQDLFSFVQEKIQP